MESSNPYQSPTTPVGPAAPPATANDWVFREGKLVVAHKMAQLPPVCFVTGQPIETWRPKTFAWHPQWVGLLVLVAVPVYVIVALLTTKRISIAIPLTHRAISDSWRRVIIAWATFLVGVPLCIGISIALNRFVVSVDQNPAPLLIGILGSVGCLIAAFVLGQLASITGVSKISGDFVWITGAGPGFLATLPEKPPQIV